MAQGERALAPGSWRRGSWPWSYEGSEPHANLVDPDAAWVRLTYTASCYSIRLQYTPRYDAADPWPAPLVVSMSAGARPRRLYLPLGGHYRVRPRYRHQSLSVKLPGHKNSRTRRATRSIALDGRGAVRLRLKTPATRRALPTLGSTLHWRRRCRHRLGAGFARRGTSGTLIFKVLLLLRRGRNLRA